MNAVRTFLLPQALKALQWEKCKGELRGLVALEGSYSSYTPIGEDPPYKKLESVVEDFIKDIELNGLHE